MRRLTAMALCGGLQAGALCAPLVHAHLDDRHGDHHGAAAVHAHFSGHQGADPRGHHAHAGVAEVSRTPDDPAITSHDDPEQTTRLQIFVAVHAAAFTAPALPPAPFVLPAAHESSTRRPPEVVRSHGPPDGDRSASRAPPARSV